MLANEQSERRLLAAGVTVRIALSDGVNLTISGGRNEFFGNHCGQQLSPNTAVDTAINSGNRFRALEILALAPGLYFTIDKLATNTAVDTEVDAGASLSANAPG